MRASLSFKAKALAWKLLPAALFLVNLGFVAASNAAMGKLMQRGNNTICPPGDTDDCSEVGIGVVREKINIKGCTEDQILQMLQHYIRAMGVDKLLHFHTSGGELCDTLLPHGPLFAMRNVETDTDRQGNVIFLSVDGGCELPSRSF
jgi:hypothetical protein